MIAAIASGEFGSGIGALTYAATRGLIAAVWQGTLLSLLVALGFRLLPKTPAAVRFAIWFAVFVVVAVLPSAGLSRGVATVHGHAAWLMLDERWCVIVAAVWVIASLVRASTLLLAVFRVRALWKRATPLDLRDAQVADGNELHSFERVRDRMTKRRAQLCASGKVDRPTVIGFFSPKILIPVWLVDKLTAAELEQIVLHEAGHLGRADDWMNLLQKAALVVFPLNPALAWVERRLCFERELACDERVLEMTGAPKAYAECLASVAEHRLQRRGLALALGVLGRESDLAQRVRRILWRGKPMRPLKARLVLGGAMLGLVVAAAALERCPELVGFSHAQEATIAVSEPRIASRPKSSEVYQTVFFHPQAASTVQLRPPLDANRPPSFSRPVSVGQKPAQRIPGLLRADAMPSEGITSEMRGALQLAAFQSDVASHESDQPAAQGNVVQWFVLSSWRGRVGSQIVLTTLRSSNSGQKLNDRPATNDVTSMQDQVHPYAAVPVNGGWLVIQL